MALILCPECKKEISSLAKSCPNCGFPLDTSNILKNNITNKIKRPKISKNCSVGKQITNWKYDAAITGVFNSSLCSDSKILEGKGSFLLHEFGISIRGPLYVLYSEIHYSQILSIEYIEKSELLETNKSVIKRALIGTILLGPLGGIVGGLSGIGSDKKYFSAIIINYWDVKNDSPYTIVFLTDKNHTAKKICSRANQEISVFNRKNN